MSFEIGQEATVPALIGGVAVNTAEALTVRDKFSGAPLGQVASCGEAEIGAAASLAATLAAGPPLPPSRRAEILLAAADLVEGRADRMRDVFVAETGFTIAEFAVDHARTVETLRLSAAEATRIAGEVVPIGSTRGQEHRSAFTLRLPIGPVCAVTPFNSPLNTVAHKLGPAIAAGNPVVLKPASATAITAHLLCEAIVDAGLPEGWLSLIFGGGAIGDLLTVDPRFAYYAFTGSTEVGLRIQGRIGLRRSQMELGAICATVVCADATLDGLAKRIANSSFRKAGQVCTSVQRLLVHRSHVERIGAELAAAALEMPAGDPRDPASAIGPMISTADAERAAAWVEEALEGGATPLTPLHREGPVLQPVVLADVAPEAKVLTEEIFAPVVTIVPFDTVEEAFAIVNSTEYGLSAGIFTADWQTAMRAAEELDVGVVQVDDTSSSRVDAMPYGGARASGFGKEGPHYAVQEMTKERLVVFNRSDR